MRDSVGLNFSFQVKVIQVFFFFFFFWYIKVYYVLTICQLVVVMSFFNQIVTNNASFTPTNNIIILDFISEGQPSFLKLVFVIELGLSYYTLRTTWM